MTYGFSPVFLRSVVAVLLLCVLTVVALAQEALSEEERTTLNAERERLVEQMTNAAFAGKSEETFLLARRSVAIDRRLHGDRHEAVAESLTQLGVTRPQPSYHFLS